MSLALRQSSTLNFFPLSTRTVSETSYTDVPNLLKLHYLGKNDYITVGESKKGAYSDHTFPLLHLTHYSRENTDSNFDITPKTEHLVSRDYRNATYITDSVANVISGSSERFFYIEVYVAHEESFRNFTIKLRENGVVDLKNNAIIRPFTNTDFLARIKEFIGQHRQSMAEDFKISKILYHDGMQIIGSKSGLIYFLDTEPSIRGLSVEGILGVDPSLIRETKILSIPTMSFEKDEQMRRVFIQESIGKSFIVQVASIYGSDEEPDDSINIWDFPYATLLFSYNLSEVISGDRRVRRITNSNLGSSRHGIYKSRITAISKNVVDKCNFLVSITVKYNVSHRNEHFLGILHCGDTADASIRLNFPKFTGHITRGLSLNTDPDFRDERRLDSQQRERILSYNTMRSIAGYPNYVFVPSDPEKLEVTAIEIINAETFVTGDNEGSIIMWKLNIENGVTDSKLTFMAKYKYEVPHEIANNSYYNCTIKKIETIGSDNQLLVHIYGSYYRPSTVELDGAFDATIVLNYSLTQDDATINPQNTSNRNWHHSNREPIIVEGEEPEDAGVPPHPRNVASVQSFITNLFRFGRNGTRAAATTTANIRFDWLQEYDDYSNITHTARGRQEMLKNIRRVFDMKKDIIEPTVKSEENLRELRKIDIVKDKGQDVMDINDNVWIYKFAAELDPNLFREEGEHDTAVLFKTENKIYMYSKEMLDSMDFPYGQMVYGCREASGEWRNDRGMNNIILDDLYVSLGTLIEDRGILVPLVPLLKIWNEGTKYPNTYKPNIISFCFINDRPEGMNKVVAVAKLPFSGGVGRLHCNAGGDDSADILYNVYAGIHEPFLPTLTHEEEEEMGLQRHSGSEPRSRSRTPSFGGKRKSNRKKYLKNKRKTKIRKTLKKNKRRTIKKNEESCVRKTNKCKGRNKKFCATG